MADKTIRQELVDLGHCEHCRNSMGEWACRESSHDTPCLRCGAVAKVEAK